MQVSVICPVFNTRPDLLEDAVRSVLMQQEDLLLEIILVDDGSTRVGTLESLDRLQREDHRIVVLSGAPNSGPAAARNRGLAHARGDWIGFLDADDLWPQGKLERAHAILTIAPDAEWIGGLEAKLGVDGVCRPSGSMSCIPSDTVTCPTAVRLTAPELTRCIILEGMHLGANLIRRQVIVRAGGFDPKVEFGEDLLLLSLISVRVSLHYSFGLSYVLRRQFSSMMWSSRRMSDRYVTGQRAARRHPGLRDFHREIRWALYRAYKEIAMNNVINCRLWRGGWYSFRALMVDPRELRDFVGFWSILIRTGGGRAAIGSFSQYSTSEIVELNGIVE